MKSDLLCLTNKEIVEAMKNLNEQEFRGKQIFQWLYKGVDSFSEMKNIPNLLQKKLENNFTITKAHIINKSKSENGSTIKYLFQFADLNTVEAVLMKHSYGNTVCISTQIGCKMGCRFCASTIGGLVRNLTAGEMIAQLLSVEFDNKTSPNMREITNVVLMGSGEPFDNYENTLRFLKLINLPDGLGVSFRNITLSTCGIVPKMELFAKEKIPVTLSISLHAPTDLKRKMIMPSASLYKIKDIIKSSQKHFVNTGRRLTFEYALIKDFNDSEEDATMLAEILDLASSHVNLIPLNQVEGLPYQRSDDATTKRFSNLLKRRHVSVTRRKEHGLDIDGACGQLRRRYNEKKKVDKE